MATQLGDVVIVHVNNAPAFFARIESIEPDVKPGWWQVTLLVLQTPLSTVVWTLRDAYIQGDGFTMGGTPIRLERVVAPAAEPTEGGLPGQEQDPEKPSPEPGGGGKGKAQVIPLAGRRKK